MEPIDEFEEAFILVKAIPHPSKKHGETVCCAGVTSQGEWRRLFPVRFRHLNNKFQRWDRVKYRWRKPTNDARRESRHVFEDTFEVGAELPRRERTRLLTPLIRRSAQDAVDKGESLTLVRPEKFKFSWKAKSKADIAEERAGYVAASRQTSMLDQDLAELEPCPFEFKVKFSDGGGDHFQTCEDWETTATFWKFNREHDSNYAINHLDHTFNHEYPKRGLVLALGNMARRPKTWLLLGILRLDKSSQGELFP